MNQVKVSPAEGRLGILVVGCGAVATTFITGVLMARKGLAKPIGSMTQFDRIRVGSGDARQYLKYEEIVPLARLSDLVFGCWDVYPQNAYQAAMFAEVLKAQDIEPVRAELEQIVPMPAAFDPNYAKRLTGDHVKAGLTRWQMVEALRDDIRRFKAEKGCSRLVVLWAASTEIYVPVEPAAHNHLADLEAAMQADDRARIAPSMCYAYAALSEGAPFIMGAPNTTVDIPAMWELAERMRMPIAGKDFKTGQTLVKSGFAPIISTRCLGLGGWFSTNILGNRDGLVLDEPENFHTKEVSKLSLLPQGAHQLLSAAKGQQRELGQYRHLRLDGLSHAGQDQLPLSRLHPGSSLVSRPLSAHRSRRPCRLLRYPALLEFLHEESDARLSGRRAACQPPLSAIYHAEKRPPRNGRLPCRRADRLNVALLPCCNVV